MYNKSFRTFHLFTMVGVLGIGTGGCVASSEEASPTEVEEATIPQEHTGETQEAYQASTSCTSSGGGTWGSILNLCVSISGGTGSFTVTKVDGSNFNTAGTMHLKVGTYETWGVDHTSSHIYGGSILRGFNFSDFFGQWPGYPKQYYARWDSDPGGYAWVGPITIYQ